MVITAEEWNAHVIHDDKSAIGIGIRCANGKCLLHFAQQYELFVTNTSLRHRRRHLVTWNFLDNQNSNEINLNQSSLEEFPTR